MARQEEAAKKEEDNKNKTEVEDKEEREEKNFNTDTRLEIFNTRVSELIDSLIFIKPPEF